MDLFSFWDEPLYIAAEYDHMVKRGKIMRVRLYGFFEAPMNVYIDGDYPKGLKKGDALKMDLRLIFWKGDYYNDEEQYRRESNSHMAAQSYISCGTFSPTMDPNFVESTTALINGEVVWFERAEENGEPFYKIELKCEEYVFRVVCPDGFGELGIHNGTVLSGLFIIDGRIYRG